MWRISQTSPTNRRTASSTPLDGEQIVMSSYWFSLNVFSGCWIYSRFVRQEGPGCSIGAGIMPTQFRSSSHAPHRNRVHSNDEAFNGNLRFLHFVWRHFFSICLIEEGRVQSFSLYWIQTENNFLVEENKTFNKSYVASASSDTADCYHDQHKFIVVKENTCD